MMNNNEPRAAVARHDNQSLTSAQTADLLGLRPRNLERLRLSGSGPRAIKHCRIVRYRIEDLHGFLDQKRSRRWAIRMMTIISRERTRAVRLVGWRVR
jgi:hypothetical protein